MCLAVPGAIVEIEEEGVFGRTGKVSFGGVVKSVNLTYVPEAKLGDYVIVHTGFALSILDQQEAAEVLGYLEQLAAVRDEAEEVAGT